MKPLNHYEIVLEIPGSPFPFQTIERAKYPHQAEKQARQTCKLCCDRIPGKTLKLEQILITNQVKK